MIISSEIMVLEKIKEIQVNLLILNLILICIMLFMQLFIYNNISTIYHIRMY